MSKFHIVKKSPKLEKIEKWGDKNTKPGGEGGEVASTQNSAHSTHRLIGVNDNGQRVGESHPRAVLTDHEVGLLLELRAEGYSYGWLAKVFEISKQHAWRICTGQKRAQYATRWKRA